MRNRSPLAVFFLSCITFGIYPIIWIVQTKEEMNELGASIPTAWLLIVPFANLYWHWRYSEAVEDITDGRASTMATFVLHLLLGPIGMAITQSAFNNVRSGNNTNTVQLEEGDMRIIIERT